MGQDKKLEAKLKTLGFKKKWLDDHSGYWLEKKFKLLKGFLKLGIETDRKILYLSFSNQREKDLKYSKKNILFWNKYLTKLTKVR
jgi:hypothetical protein